MMIKTIRHREGSVLILGILLTSFIVVPLLVLLFRLNLSIGEATSSQSAVEAAGLLAANDISRIIINDSKFGYVSLSNYPPVGKAMLAPDGEPLPVIGINTLIGTIRQNAIVARELQNEYMVSLVDIDRTCLAETIDNLNSVLSKVLSGKSTGAFDIQGEKVNPVEDVKVFLNKNLPAGVTLDSVKLSNGWLISGGGTNTSIPKPENLAELKPGTFQMDEYKPFIDVPVANGSFTFAGLGRASSICKLSNFRQADKKHICSIVKIECTVTMGPDTNGLLPSSSGTKSTIKFAACCEPYSNPDIGPAGVMTLRFSGGGVPGLQSWSDLINNASFRDNQVITYDVVGGDYPIDRDARVQRSGLDLQTTTAQEFSGHLYDWLRNGHLRPRVDAILAMMRDTFPISSAEQFFVYEFEKNGTINRRILARDPFPVGVTSDAQSSAMADTNTRSGLPMIIVFRNDVRNIGIQNGGKHGGQPLAGYPLNWCELQDFGGDEQLALLAGKGRLGTQLMLADAGGSVSLDDSVNNLGYALFKTFDGKKLSRQPRRTYYSGGLALDIEIGGTRTSDPNIDVVSMRHLRFVRRI